ncbi:heparan-alpha-glucosaminide N-acetyltransferase domain-containing protein [Glutamicibacter sp. AOP12-B1-11]|uniref:heparan-alpha-glucosaminide N-acetyltransferase domain-containing protein n=1 Tax=Glutamicibacter sp. AOP12-B1-11 TaxID=3457725 RepID=UPI0040339FB5
MDVETKARRLPGLDAARALAILGMFAAHIFDLFARDATGALQPTLTGAAANGRSSVLFMVLAGVSLTLFARALERKGMDRKSSSLVLLRRAAVIAALGMLIGPANESIANILVHYGLLFLVLIPALFVPAKVLWALAGGWLLLAPLIWRPLAAGDAGASLNHNPTFTDFAHPGLLLEDLLVTGYYPLLIWIGYGLLGVAVGKLRLASRGTVAWLAAGSVVVAALSLLIGWLKILPWVDGIGAVSGVPRSQLFTALVTGRSPSGNLDSFMTQSAYIWLPTAHSGSLIFTIHAAACAVALLAVSLLSIPYLGYFGQLIASAGRAPLTLYIGHLILLPMLQLGLSQWTQWWVLCVLMLLTALILRHTRRAGPLEAGIRYLSELPNADHKENPS